MKTDVNKRYIDSLKINKLDYQSSKFRKNLEKVVKRNEILMKFKEIDSSKMSLTFQPISAKDYYQSKFFDLVKNYFINIHQQFFNLYRKF